MVLARKESIINNFKKYQNNLYKNCLKSINEAKYKKRVYYLSKKSFFN